MIKQHTAHKIYIKVQKIYKDDTFCIYNRLAYRESDEEWNFRKILKCTSHFNESEEGRTSLVVLQLRLCTPSVEGQVWLLFRELNLCHMLQLRPGTAK